MRQLAFAGEPGGGPAFGKRKERPEAEMPRILNPAPSGASLRTPRSVSPPLAD